MNVYCPYWATLLLESAPLLPSRITSSGEWGFLAKTTLLAPANKTAAVPPARPSRPSLGALRLQAFSAEPSPYLLDKLGSTPPTTRYLPRRPAKAGVRTWGRARGPGLPRFPPCRSSAPGKGRGLSGPRGSRGLA